MPADRRFPPRRGGEERPHPYQPPHQPARLPGPPPRQGEGLPFTTSFRLRDGDREVEVSGSAGFVRQVLDELPALVSRLRGETGPTPSSIRMPSPGAGRPALEAAGSPSGEPPAKQAEEPESGDGKVSPAANGRGGRSLEDRVITMLRGAGHPLPVAEIRGRLGGDVSGQQVRRILERAGGQVVATSDRPIRYRLR
jgi:hypothetical protein